MRASLRYAAAFLALIAATSVGCSHKSPTRPGYREAGSTTSLGSFDRGVSIAAKVQKAPPRVTITSPQPDLFLEPQLPANFTLQWSVVDPDGPGSDPKSFRYRLITQSDVEDYPLTLIDPDSLMRKSAPRFDGWTVVDGRLRSTEIQNLVPTQAYLLVLIAIDRRGDYDDQLSLDRNILRFSVLRPLNPGASPGAD